jgi:hypothetical protein
MLWCSEAVSLNERMKPTGCIGGSGPRTRSTANPDLRVTGRPPPRIITTTTTTTTRAPRQLKKISFFLAIQPLPPPPLRTSRSSASSSSSTPPPSVASPGRSGARFRCAGGRGDEEEGEDRMGNPHGGLDEEIEQLLQCKPLAEPKVRLFSPHTCFRFLAVWFWMFLVPARVDSAGSAGRTDPLPAFS